jgi:hypothetical protein
MGDLPQAAIDLLPLSAEPMSQWKQELDIRQFSRALYPPPFYSPSIVELDDEVVEETVTLFEVDLPLGKIKQIHNQAKLMNEQEVKEKLAKQKESEIQLKFVPSASSRGLLCKMVNDWTTKVVTNATFHFPSGE